MLQLSDAGALIMGGRTHKEARQIISRLCPIKPVNTRKDTDMPRIERQTCEYVLASDLFEGLVSLQTVLMQCNCGFTWGGNNRSLVTAESILNVLDQTDCSPLLMGKLRKRVDEIGLQTYIDLEN